MSEPISPCLINLLAGLPGIPASRQSYHVTILVLALEFHRHGDRWLSSRRSVTGSSSVDKSLAEALAQGGLELNPRQNERLRECHSLTDLLRGFHLKGVPLACQEGLLGWLEGRYPLDLRLEIPSPREMLDHQCLGRRFVTFRPEPELLFKKIGRHAGTLEFALHDLEHAHKYLGEPTLMHGQFHFFHHLRDALDAGLFVDLEKDRQFASEFDYLMADMNSHPLHLWKYLKAILMNAYLRRGNSRYDDFIRDLVQYWRWPKEVCDAAVRINHPGVEQESDRLLVSAHLTDRQEQSDGIHTMQRGSLCRPV